ncbi:hypothetical protein EWI61_12430 [Methylolobus aquaticus]|nr:hypothetical protein EWI61_12430 [Methylolobus aquaticus]
MKFPEIAFCTPVKGGRFRTSGRVLLALLVISSAAGPCRAEAPAPACAPDAETTAEGIGLQAASVVSSVFYLPAKSMMALAGGLAGGIAYAFSLGNLEIAEGVWGPSVYGTYLLTPEHLSGCKPIEFFGTVPTAGR